MPLVNFYKIGYIYIPYYQLVFKNDIIKVDCKYPNIVKEVFYYKGERKEVCFSIKCFNCNGEYNHYINFIELEKRPFVNWIKYLIAVIFKKYIK